MQYAVLIAVTPDEDVDLTMNFLTSWRLIRDV